MKLKIGSLSDQFHLAYDISIVAIYLFTFSDNNEATMLANASI